MPAYLLVYVIAAVLLLMAIGCFCFAWHRDQTPHRDTYVHERPLR